MVPEGVEQEGQVALHSSGCQRQYWPKHLSDSLSLGASADLLGTQVSVHTPPIPPPPLLSL